MKQWAVAHTLAGKEKIAEQHLLEQGYAVYLPQYKKICRHARKVKEILAPLFPRYLFVGLDLQAARWRSVNGTRGVSYLLTFNDQPAIVSHNIIDNLKAQENSAGLVLVSSVALFVKGDKVRIIDGVFTDQLAVVDALDDKQRVQVLLNFLGREMKIALSTYAVEAA